MANIVGNLVVNLAANIASFESSMRRAARESERRMGQIRKSVRGVERRLNNFAGTAQAAFAVIGSGMAVRSIINASVQMERINNALKVATGSSQAAATEFAFVRSEAERLGLDLASSAEQYARLAAAARGTVLQGQETRDIFIAVSEAATVLGLSAEQTQGALNAIEQMISKGKISAEELRGQLGERLPGAFQIAARAMGKSTAELDKMLSTGKITAEEMLPKLAAELRKTFGPQVAEAVDGTQQKINRFNTALFEFKNQLAQGGLVDAFSTSLGFIGNALSKLDDITISTMGRTLENIENHRAMLEGLFLRIQQIWGRLASGIGGILADLLEKIRTGFDSIQQMVLPLGQKLQAVPGFQVLAGKLTAFGTAETPQLDAAIAKLRKVGLTSGEVADMLAEAAQKHQDNLALIRSTTTAMFMDAAGMSNTAIKPASSSNTGTKKKMDYEKEYQEYAKFLKDSGIDVESSANKTAGAWAKAWNDAFSNTKKAADDTFSFLEQAAGGAARSMQSTMADFFYNMDGDIKGMLKGFIDAVRRMIAEMLAFQTLKATLGQFDMFASFFAVPGKAVGGPVSAGKPYLVGEKGPELMVPNSSGTIIPNNKMGGSSITVNMPVDARGAMSPGQVKMMVDGAKQEIYYNLPRILNGYAPVGA